MLRILFLLGALPMLWSQGGFKINWTCPPTGRFSVAHCKNCRPHYCMDGQHFHEDEGPVPGWVISHFAEIKRNGEEMATRLGAKRADLQAAHQANVSKAKALNEKYAREHEEFMRRVQRGERPQGARVLHPAMTTLAETDPAGPPPAPQRTISRADISAIEPGGLKSVVIERLGQPISAITIPNDDGVTESLSYRLDDGGTARISIVNGKIAGIELP